MPVAIAGIDTITISVTANTISSGSPMERSTASLSPDRQTFFSSFWTALTK